MTGTMSVKRSSGGSILPFLVSSFGDLQCKDPVSYTRMANEGEAYRSIVIENVTCRLGISITSNVVISAGE